MEKSYFATLKIYCLTAKIFFCVVSVQLKVAVVQNKDL